jgi:hypothetical protein
MFYIPIVFICFALQTVSAQYYIGGQVLNQKREKLEDAQITFMQKDSLKAMALTKSDGKFMIKGLKKGEYAVEIRHPGYNAIQQNLTVNKDMRLEFLLYHELTDTIPDIAVVADRQDRFKTTTQGQEFFLSALAKSTKDIYNALQEVPKLNVNAIDRTINIAGGGSVLVLINGVHRGNSLETIDPKDIISVEVMDTPSARYLGSGVTNVINIKTKTRMEKYQLLNIGTEDNPGLYFGTASGGYEIGSPKFSLYLNGNTFYFNNNHADETKIQQSKTMHKQYVGRDDLDYLSYNTTLGGDWIANDKNYFSYNVSLRNIPESGTLKGNGTILQNGSTSDYHIYRHDKSSALVNVYNLYYQHKFSSQDMLENQATFTYNRNDDREETNETGESYLYDNQYRFKMDYYRGYTFSEFKRHTDMYDLNLGSQTIYEKTRVENASLNNPDFTHHRLKEYLHADFNNGVTKFGRYTLSTGLDLIFNKSENIKKNYYRFKYDVAYLLPDTRYTQFRLYARGYTNEPSVSYLNPYNTSTDSLYIYQGNPHLEPYYYKDFGLSCYFIKGQSFFNPEIIYSYCTDMITPVGRYDDRNVYTSTFENNGVERHLIVKGMLWYPIKNVGHISYTCAYNRYFFYNGVKKWFTQSISGYFHYKSFYLSSHVDLFPAIYTPVQKSKSSIESLATLGWTINSHWVATASLRYFLGRKKFEVWMDQPGYSSYYCRTFDERHNMFLIGLRYTWKNRSPYKARSKSKPSVNNERINLLKEQ